MHQCQQLHETIVRDIIDVIDNVKDHDQIEWLRSRNNVGSIARMTNNLVLVFPVICSTSISISTASIISKAIERKCVSLLQILFSAMQLTSADNMYDYIKQFHSNINFKGNIVTLDDFITIMDKAVDEGAITFTDREIYDMVMEDMKNINYHLDNYINPVSINEYHISRDYAGNTSVVCEAKQRGNNNYYHKDTGHNKTITNTTSNNRSNNNNPRNSNNNTIFNTTNNYGAKNDSGSDSVKSKVEYFRNQLSTGEVNKANELMPTTMIVNFKTRTDHGTYEDSTGVIGVKAKLYPVDAMDICNRIAAKYTESNGLFNLVRASTREISFFKDLAFAIDKAKFDAVNMARESNNAKIFKLLERRANKNRFSALMKKNDASAITSLIISQDEVEYLRKYNSIDMEKPYITRTILEKYNLMDMVIADESLEVAKFLYDDGDGVYEVMAFDSLEKEAKDSSYKKVVNLMSKVSR